MKGKIGPHNGKEIELLLAGKKPVALFGMSREGQDAVRRAVKVGLAIASFPNNRLKKEKRLYVIARTEAEADAAAKALYVLYSNDAILDSDAVGKILGYSEKDLLAFKNNMVKQLSKLSPADLQELNQRALEMLQ